MISVIISAFQRPESLKKTINALLNQTLAKNEFEIIVIVNEKDEKVLAIKENLEEKGVKVIETKEFFPDKKRNIGIKNAKGEIIAFTDDDCLPEKNWLENIKNAFEKDNELTGIEGLTFTNNKKISHHATQNITAGNYPACNLAFKKTALIEVNGFDEKYNFFREDTDLAFKLLSKGKKIIFSKKVKVFHPPRKIKLLNYLKELKMIKGDIRLWKKFPVLYKKHFGFVCKGLIKQSILSFILLFLLFFGLIFNLWLALISLIAIFMAKYFILLKGKEFTIIEGILFSIITFLKDILFPFYFFYYFITEKV